MAVLALLAALFAAGLIAAGGLGRRGCPRCPPCGGGVVTNCRPTRPVATALFVTGSGRNGVGDPAAFCHTSNFGGYGDDLVGTLTYNAGLGYWTGSVADGSGTIANLIFRCVNVAGSWFWSLEVSPPGGGATCAVTATAAVTGGTGFSTDPLHYRFGFARTTSSNPLPAACCPGSPTSGGLYLDVME